MAAADPNGKASAQNGDRVSSFPHLNAQRTDTSFSRLGIQAKSNFRLPGFPVWSTRSFTFSGGAARSSVGGGQLEPEVLNVHQCRTKRTEKGQHTVVLSVEGSKEKADPQKRKFQWLHFTAKEHMQLQQLRESVMAVKDLEPRRVGLLKLLFDQVKRNERNFVHGKYLEPSVFKQSGTDPITGETSHVSFVAYSYLTLDEHKTTRKPTTTPPDIHPPRALMQTHFRLAPSETRDLKQVYRLHKGKKETKLLYIPQFWAVFMDHDVLVTYSCLSLEQLSANGNFIKQELQPTTSEPRVIRFTNEAGDAYNFPVETCLTWFEFCQRLVASKAGKTSKNTRFVCGATTIVSAENWTEFLEKQTAETIDLRFAKKSQWTATQVPSAFTQRIPTQVHSAFTLVPEQAQLVKADRGIYASPQAARSLPPSRLKDSYTAEQLEKESQTPSTAGSTGSRGKQVATQGYTSLARQAMQSQAGSNTMKTKAIASGLSNGHDTTGSDGSSRNPFPGTNTPSWKQASGLSSDTVQTTGPVTDRPGYVGPVDPSNTMNGAAPSGPQPTSTFNTTIKSALPVGITNTAALGRDPSIFENVDRNDPFACVQLLEDVLITILRPVMCYKERSLAFRAPYRAFNLVQAFEASMHIPRDAHDVYNDYLCFHFTRHLEFVSNDGSESNVQRVDEWVRNHPAFSVGSNVPYGKRVTLFMQEFGPTSQPWLCTGAGQRATFEDYWSQTYSNLRTQSQISRITRLDELGYPRPYTFRGLDADMHTLEIEFLPHLAWLRYLPGMFADRHVWAFETFLSERYPTIANRYVKGYLFCQTLMPRNEQWLDPLRLVRDLVVLNQEHALYEWLYRILLSDNRYKGPKAVGTPVPIDYYLLREVFLRDWGRFGLGLGNGVLDFNGRVPKLSDYFPDSRTETRGRTTTRQPRPGVRMRQEGDANDIWPKDSASRIRKQDSILEGVPHDSEMNKYVLRTATPSPRGMQPRSAKESKRRRPASRNFQTSSSLAVQHYSDGRDENSLPLKVRYRAHVQDAIDGSDSDDLKPNPTAPSPRYAVPRFPPHVPGYKDPKYKARVEDAIEGVDDSTPDEETPTDVWDPAEDTSTGRIQPEDESSQLMNERSTEKHTVLLEVKRMEIEGMEQALFGRAVEKPLRATASNELPQSPGQEIGAGDTINGIFAPRRKELQHMNEDSPDEDTDLLDAKRVRIEKMEEVLFGTSHREPSREREPSRSIDRNELPRSSGPKPRSSSEGSPEALCILDEDNPPCPPSALLSPSLPSHSTTDLSQPKSTVHAKERLNAVSVPRGLSLLISPAKSNTAAAGNLSLTQRSPTTSPTAPMNYELVEFDPLGRAHDLPGRPHAPTPPGSPQSVNADPKIPNIEQDMQYPTIVTTHSKNQYNPAVFDVVYADAMRTRASNPAPLSGTYLLNLKPREVSTVPIVQVIDADVLKESETANAFPASEQETLFSPIPLADPRHLNLDEILELLGQKDIDFSYDFVTEDDSRVVERGMICMGKHSTSLVYAHRTATHYVDLEDTSFEYKHVSFPSIENGDAASNGTHGRSGNSSDSDRQRLLEGTEGRPKPGFCNRITPGQSDPSQLMLREIAADVSYTSFPALPEDSSAEPSRTTTPDVELEAMTIEAYEFESGNSSEDNGESSCNVSIRLIDEGTDEDEPDAPLDIEVQYWNHPYHNSILGGPPVLLLCNAPRSPLSLQGDVTDLMQERRFILMNQWLTPITFDAEPSHSSRQNEDTDDALVLRGHNFRSTTTTPLQRAMELYDEETGAPLSLHEILALLGQFDLHFDYCFEVGPYASQRLLTENGEGFEVFFGTIQDDGLDEEDKDSSSNRPNYPSGVEEFNLRRRAIEWPYEVTDPDGEVLLLEYDDRLLIECGGSVHEIDSQAARANGDDGGSRLDIVLHGENLSITSASSKETDTDYRHSVVPVDAYSIISPTEDNSIKCDSVLDYSSHDETAGQTFMHIYLNEACNGAYITALKTSNVWDEQSSSGSASVLATEDSELAIQDFRIEPDARPISDTDNRSHSLGEEREEGGGISASRRSSRELKSDNESRTAMTTISTHEYDTRSYRQALDEDPDYVFQFQVHETDSDDGASVTYKTKEALDTPSISLETTNGVLPSSESAGATSLHEDSPIPNEQDAKNVHQDSEKAESVSPEIPTSLVGEMSGDVAPAGETLTNGRASTSSNTPITHRQQDVPDLDHNKSDEIKKTPESHDVVENSTQERDQSRSPKPKVHFADPEESTVVLADRRYILPEGSSATPTAIPTVNALADEGPLLTSEAKRKAIPTPTDLPNITESAGDSGRQDDQNTDPNAIPSQGSGAQTARYYIQAPKADHPHFLKWPQKKSSDTDSLKNGLPTGTTTSTALILSPKLPSGDPRPKQWAMVSLTDVAKQEEIDMANKRLADLLEDAHKWCHESKRYRGKLRRLYDESESATQAVFEEAMNVAIERKEAQILLLHVKSESSLSTNRYMGFADNVEWVRRNCGLQVTKLQLATDLVALLELFAPLQTPCILFRKVFGVLCTILQLPLCKCNEELLADLQQSVLEYMVLCKEIEYGVSSSYKATIVSFRYMLPSELTEAYFCFVQHLICSVRDRAAVNPKPDVSVDRFADLREEIRSKLIASKHALIAMATTDYEPELFNYLGMEGLFAFIVAGLEERGKLPVNETNGLVGMYTDFVQKLQLKIEEHPTRRMLEDLNHASSEIKVVLKFLKDRVTYNNEWLKLLRETLNGRHYSAQKFTFETIRKWHQNSKETERNLRDISMQIDELRTRTVQLVDLKNEDQSLAIFVFTIVTIIFLPLSFVTSFFGMNTTDIREINLDQRIFWVISIPLTVLVAVFALAVGLRGNRVRSAWTERKFRKTEEDKS